MPPSDRIRLQHILDAARDSLEFTAGLPKTGLHQNRLVLHALLRCLEIIGEAASKVTPITRAELPELPWAQMVAMRHRLAHAYFDVDLDLVWETLQDDLRPLISRVEKVLSP